MDNKLCKVCKIDTNNSYQPNCSQDCCRKTNADIWDKNKKKVREIKQE